MKIANCLLLFLFTTNCILTSLLNTDKKLGRASNAILLALGGASTSTGSAEVHDSEPAGGGTVTSSGTTLRSNDGMITIDIPEGAVTETIEFTISRYTPATNSYPGSYLPTSSAYEITPSYRFKKPVSVSMSLNTSTIQSLNLSKAKSLGFSYSTTSVTSDSGRFPSWMAHQTTVMGDKVVFNTETFSIFGLGTPPPGNQPPINLGAFYYFKVGCDYLPFMLRTRVIDPDGDPVQVYLITGPGNGGAVAIPMTREGTTDWYTANIPYEAMSSMGIQMQISASDSGGQTSFVPSNGIFSYPTSSNNSLFISSYNRDKDGDGLLCAWERDNSKSDTNAGDAGGVVDSDGDGIPNVSDFTPNGEANPPIDSLQIFPANVSLDLTEKVIFGVTASMGGSPRYVNASYVATGLGLNGGPVGSMTHSSFLPSVPGAAGVVATVGAMNSTATVSIFDTLGPNDITTLVAIPLSTNKIQLQWLAPGDDNNFGRAVTYQVYRSTTTISNNDNCNGVLVNHTLVPKTAGISERLEVSGLSPATTYFFCIRAVDDNGNFNRWNGTVSATTYTTPDLTPPADITSVTATSLGIDRIQLSWTAVGDDGNSGSAQNYDIYRSTSPIVTNSQCRSGVIIPNNVPSSPSGTLLSYTVSNLADNTVFYFCIVAVDESNNYSNWSGVSTASTLRKNLAPTITLPDSLSDLLPNTILLNASLSGDPDAVACGANVANYVFNWTLLNKPPTSALTSGSLSGGNSKVATFTPDVAGDYTVQFSFADDKGSCGGTNLVNVKSIVVTIAKLPGIKHWTRLFGVQHGLTVSRGISSDSYGNVYTTGYTSGNLDGQTLTGSTDLFVVKYNSKGTKQWTRLLGVSGAWIEANAITSDLSGNVYTTGVTYVNLDGQTVTGTPDLFIVKYNSDGIKQWTRLLGQSGTYTLANGITSDSYGNVYATGRTLGNLDGQTLGGTNGLFVVKYNSDGVKQWTRLLGGSGGWIEAKGIASDQNGNVYTTGYTSANLDGQTLTGSTDLFVVKYNSDGIKQWTRLLGGLAISTIAKGISSDSSGNVYTTGYTSGNLDGQTVSGMNDLVVVKYNSDGIKQWTRLLGGSGTLTIANGISTDGSGNVYTTGYTQGNLDGQTKQGISDLFVVKYNSDGIKQWTRLLGVSGGQTTANCISSDSYGNVYTTGYTSGNLDGQTKLGSNDSFVVKYE